MSILRNQIREDSLGYKVNYLMSILRNQIREDSLGYKVEFNKKMGS